MRDTFKGDFQKQVQKYRKKKMNCRIPQTNKTNETKNETKNKTKKT